MAIRYLLAALTLTLLASLGGAADALAQAYPVKGKPITLIVPFAAGGVTDTGARLLAADLEKELQTQVIVLTKPGAGSQLGMTELVRAAPDGYTIAAAALPTVVTHYLDASRNAIYTRTDFQPVAMHHFVPNLIVVRAESPWKTMKDLVEAARAAPQKVSIAGPGLMTTPHLMVMELENATGVKFAAVHFNGNAQSVTALLGGHVDALSGAIADALQHTQSGAWRVLGVAAEKPAESLPDAPTMKSQGYDVLAASWVGIVAPKGTPQPIVDVLTQAIARIVASPEHQKRLRDLGVIPNYLGPADFTAVWIDNEKRAKAVLDRVAQQK